jgi:nucleotide-binding universal stress UspA family protein
MTYKHLLVHADSPPRSAERLELAVALAKRFGARLTGLFAELDSLGPSVVARRAQEDMSRAAAEARARFEAATDGAGFATDWWQLESGEYAQVVGPTAICCRYADLSIFGQHDAEKSRVPEDLVEQVVFGSGRPVLVVPKVGRYPDAGKRVVVAWNGSPEAARALNDAIPLMRDAESVTVLAFQKPSAGTGPGSVPAVDIATHLRAHGIAVRYERVFVGGDEVGVADTVLNRSFDLQADLVVMGVHAQTGFPSPRAGGSARKLLQSMTAPVLLSR